MKNLVKKLSAVIITTAVLFTTVFSASVFVNAATFTPRLSAPDRSNPYYYNADYNVFYGAGYGMPNCTAYAYGRAYEILGHEPNLSWNGAGLWYDYNRNGGYYSYGKTPKVGAIACWEYGSGGHVAVVEEIDDYGNMTLSNSAWQGTNFYLTYAHTSDSNPGGNSWWNFQGYIYIIDNPVQTKAEQTTTPTTTAPKASSYKTGTYLVDAQPYLNMRTGAGTAYNLFATVDDAAKIVVTKVTYSDGYNWGYVTYNNNSGWVALEFCTYLSSSMEEVTTVAPTTVPRTTVAPTTVPRTTAAPATVPRTTVAPTTVPRTTVAPTTVPATTVPATTVPATTTSTRIFDGYGDMDGDGSVTILDATLIQKYLAKMIKFKPSQFKYADFDRNGDVTIDDVTAVQRYLLVS